MNRACSNILTNPKQDHHRCIYPHKEFSQNHFQNLMGYNQIYVLGLQYLYLPRIFISTEVFVSPRVSVSVSAKSIHIQQGYPYLRGYFNLLTYLSPQGNP